MKEILQSTYSKVNSLLNSVPFNNLFARVVIEKKVNEKVFVDNETNPSVIIAFL